VTITEAADGSWQLQLPGAETMVLANEDTIARLLLTRVKQAVQPSSHPFTHTPYMNFSNRSHR
jgi:hypothetical protein